MNDEQNRQDQEAAPDFGDIQITPQPDASAGEVVRTRPHSAAAPPKAHRQRPSERGGRRKPAGRSRWPGLLVLIVLLTLPALYVLFCLVGLPLLLQGPLAQRLSVQTGRPVSIGEARLSPFSLDLHLAEIAVGPETSKADEPELARIETADGRIRPAALLRGKIVLEDVRLDRLRATLIRRADGTYSSPSPGSGLALIPDWLFVQGLRLNRGTIHFIDQLNSRKHLIEQIEFILPNAAGKDADKAVEPVLSAVVNSSPVQIKGRRSDGETRLALTLNDFDPQQHLSWLPGLAETVTVSAARADAALELIVQDQSEQGLTLSGTVTASNLTVQSAEDKDADEKFRLTAPKIKMVLRANPLRSQYAVEELHLEEPLLETAGKADAGGRRLAAQAAGLLNRSGTTLTVEKLLLRKGTYKVGGEVWSDVQAELNGFQNIKAAGTAESRPAGLSLSAKNGSSAFSFKGEADPAFVLSGTVDLKNMAASSLQPCLADGLRLAQGSADLSGALRLDGKGMRISGGTVGLRNFILQQNKAALVSGKALNGADCVLDGVGRSIACGRVTIDQAEFAAEAPALFLSGGKPSLSFKTVEIRNSAASLPIVGAAPLALSGLSLNADGQNKLQLAAAVGAHGSIEIANAALIKADSGPSLSGAIRLQGVNAGIINPYLASDSQPRLAQGTADISGAGSLSAGPGGMALALSDGAVTVRDFVFQHNGATLVTGKILNGSGCALGSSGLACAKLGLSQAEFAAAAPAFFLRSAGGLKCSAQEVAVTESSALLPLGAGMPLPLSGLALQWNSGTLRLEAAAGDSSSIHAEGTLDRNGGGTLALTAAGVDLGLISRAAGLFRDNLTLKQGSLSCNGQVALPEGRFSGEFSIAQLAAEGKGGEMLRWERLTGSKADFTLSPFAAAAESLSLQAPVVRLAAAETGIAAGLLALLHDAPLLTAEQCSLSGGSLELVGGSSAFSGVEGSIAPLRAGSEASFALSGTMGGGSFAVKGKADAGSVVLAELTVEALPLNKAAQELAQALEADPAAAQVSRTISPAEDRLDLSGFAPKPGSAFALPLSLLTEEDGGFSLRLQNMPAGASEAELSAAAEAELRRLRLQAAAAPERLLPGLADLPRSIEFLPGGKVTDFMRGLDGYAALVKTRPHLGLAVRGCFDKDADRNLLLAERQKEEDSRVKAENLRREEKLQQLIAEELTQRPGPENGDQPDGFPELRPLVPQQAELPENALPDLARARAEVIRSQLVDRMNIPQERVTVQESGSCGARAELAPMPIW